MWEELEYHCYLQLVRPATLFMRVHSDYVPPTVMTLDEWRTHRAQLHPTRYDLTKLLPNQIVQFPGNYEWWCLPEEDEDPDCDC
jgi:hypothetical protein